MTFLRYSQHNGVSLTSWYLSFYLNSRNLPWLKSTRLRGQKCKSALVGLTKPSRCIHRYAPHNSLYPSRIFALDGFQSPSLFTQYRLFDVTIYSTLTHNRMSS